MRDAKSVKNDFVQVNNFNKIFETKLGRIWMLKIYKLTGCNLQLKVASKKEIITIIWQSSLAQLNYFIESSSSYIKYASFNGIDYLPGNDI